MKKGLIVTLGLMTVVFLAACEKQPSNVDVVDNPDIVVNVNWEDGGENIENGEIENIDNIDNGEINFVENGGVDNWEVDNWEANIVETYAKTSLTVDDLNEIDSVLFPIWYNYQVYDSQTWDPKDQWEYVYPEDISHTLLLPIHATMANREIVSSAIEDGMIYTLANVELQDWSVAMVLYINNPTTLEYLSASVNTDSEVTLYGFNY